MNANPDAPDGPLNARLNGIDRRIRRDQLRRKIEELGGLVGGSEGEEVSEAELSFLERVVAWETGPRSSHRDWLRRAGQTFIPPAELAGSRLEQELWRLIHALAAARVFLYHTNHLDDAQLYQQLWTDVLPVECPDSARTPDDACHWDFADPGSDEEQTWLRFYATPAERQEWVMDFPATKLPESCRPPHRRDHRLPARD